MHSVQSDEARAPPGYTHTAITLLLGSESMYLLYYWNLTH